MDRTLVILALVVSLSLAGCSVNLGDRSAARDDSGGLDGADTDTVTPIPMGADTATPMASPTATGTATKTTGAGTVTPPATVGGTHPYLADGSIDAAALVSAHVGVLGSSSSFTLTDNGTFSYVTNGSLAGTITSVRRVDLADERRRLLLQSSAPNGTIQTMSARFANATTTCTYFGDSTECAAGGFDRQRALSEVIEVTSLETVAGPVFSPDGTVTHDGRELYRYSASEFRSPLPESVAGELGPAPSLRNATLLVAPSGRIVSYHLVYEQGEDDARISVERTYRTTALGETTVERPSWVTG